MVSTPTARKRLGPEQEGSPPVLPENGAAPRTPEDIATYLAHMTAEMAAMSRAAGYDLLAYFLDMARIEAKIQADQKKG